MEIIINKKELDLPAITKAGIETAGETHSVPVTAETSLLGGLRYEIPCTIKQEGEVMFYDEITIKSTTTNVYISDGDITFKGKRLTGEAAYFPEYENIDVNTVDMDALLSAMTVAMPSSDYGCLIESRGDMVSFVGTDRIELRKVDIPITSGYHPFYLVIREKHMKDLMKFITTAKETKENQEIRIVNSASHLIIHQKTWEYGIPHWDVKFPPYQALVDGLHSTGGLMLDIQHATRALECALVKSRDILLTKESNGTYLSANSEDRGAFEPYKVSGNELPVRKIKLNGRRLLEGIRHYAGFSGSKEVTIEFQKDDLSPVFIKGSGYTYILAPMV